MREDALDLAMTLVEEFEGFRSHPYLCPAGIWTIGYGLTYTEDGRPVRPDTPPVQRELALLRARAVLGRVYGDQVAIYVPGVGERPRLHAALTDFAFNLGVTRFAGSTLRKRAQKDDLEGVAIELKKWVRGGGRILPGLVRRREAEIKLIMG